MKHCMPKVNQAAFDIGQLAERLYQGYYLHSAMLEVAKHPNVEGLAPSIEVNQRVSVGRVYRNDGSTHTYHFTHYLTWVNNPLVADDLVRVWLVGAFLRLGDELEQNEYFDRAPELELMRHLRNGVAHGNRFRITSSYQLVKFPAHNRLAWVRGSRVFEISPALHRDPVLFDFMGAGDCLDLLQSIGVYLIRMGNGDPLRA